MSDIFSEAEQTDAEDWLLNHCKPGDLLQLVESSGVVALRNKRTKGILVLKVPGDGDSKGPT